MKLLKDILYRTGMEEVSGPMNLAVENIHMDSRQVTAFSLFVAVKGVQVDGHEYIGTAIEKGALAVVCEVLPDERKPGVTYVRVKDTSEALGQIASNFYDNPSSRLKLIGVTGTNGKTTTVSLLYKLFVNLGYKCGLISTVVNRIGHKSLDATHTTPDAISLQKLFREMLDAGVTHCFMEVSSHAIHQRRIAGTSFDIAIFSNITHDHLDYHGTFDEYIKAKKLFFDKLSVESIALVNQDDPHGEIMVQNTKAKAYFYAIRGMADFRARIIENHFQGLHILLDGNDLYSKLVGGFNAYNLLAVYSTAVLLGEDKLSVLTSLSQLDSVVGRFQHMRTNQGITAIVDYAHTPDALKNVLRTIQEVRTGNEKVITVIGCGGDRDRAKRPIMAAVACEFADQVILTSDNPRSEDPTAIIEDMKKGVEGQHYKKTLSIVDRREAIRTACTMAAPGDILLIAGKGHEKYQEVAGVKHPFDDFQILGETLKTLEG
ncbi:MAG: UDP-N-acetylmuramoyl-L-alanyl-D-glutamate--2,6-diaminopimelate ligase [Bacteroidetes bacterium]|jgi:UDP-N-acetylmuramoyl-L-alanyl-D-glutamate--2,6-diaminopimelate ligase|nr:UDP-N-acetylmuramoyl-L-alanyl-D-glutamate--2,6-diaminopimelate ligase [Bacteroidota bacterium]